VLRGTFIVRHTLCLPLPDPPADADNTPPPPAAGRSVRALTDAKTMTGTCASCHSLINPIGYALENYDAMGRFQTTEPGNVAVDSSATITGTDLAGAVMGGVGLSGKLADSAMARGCVVERWFTRALSRAPGEDDACLVEGLKEGFKKSDNLRDLVVAIASSDAALFGKEAP
jgi:hypothetical protein